MNLNRNQPATMRRRRTNQYVDEDMSYKISKFVIVLQPTPRKITDDMVASVLGPILEETLFNVMGGAQTQSKGVLLAHAFVEEIVEGGEEEGNDDDTRRLQLPGSTQGETITRTSSTLGNRFLLEEEKMSNTIANNRTTRANDTTTTIVNSTEQPSTKIIVKGGLISFKFKPPVEEIPKVIEAGINDDLVANLPKDNPFFSPITSATFATIQSMRPPPLMISPTERPMESPTAEHSSPPFHPPELLATMSPGDRTIGNNNDPVTESNGASWIGANVATFVVLFGVGIIAIAIAIAIARRRRRKRQHHTKLQDTSFETKGTQDDEEEGEDGDNKSMSEWTTATTETQNHQYLCKSQYLASEETFARNSLVAVKKDMLESEWSTYNPRSPRIIEN